MSLVSSTTTCTTTNCNTNSNTNTHRRSGSLNKSPLPEQQQKVDDSACTLTNCSSYYYYEEDDQVLEIEQNINFMDNFYDATFGAWIRDHRNLSQALPHLLRVAQEYPWTCLPPVLNYLTVDWPLDAILHLLQSLTHLHPNAYGALIGRFLGPFPMEVQIVILRGLRCQEYFSVEAWKMFLQEGWDFSTAAVLLGALFECSHAKQLLKSIYS